MSYCGSDALVVRFLSLLKTAMKFLFFSDEACKKYSVQVTSKLDSGSNPLVTTYTCSHDDDEQNCLNYECQIVEGSGQKTDFFYKWNRQWHIGETPCKQGKLSTLVSHCQICLLNHECCGIDYVHVFRV